MAPCCQSSEAPAAVNTPAPRQHTAATEGASTVKPHEALRTPQAPMRSKSSFDSPQL